MAVRQILAMKRAAIQSRLDALSAQDMSLRAEIARLQTQPVGLKRDAAADQFQVAAQTSFGARRVAARLQDKREPLTEEIEALAREKLALDLADRKLAEEDRRVARLEASRADLRS